MKVECEDLERVLRGQEPAELAALKSHAQECAACRAELEAWNELSIAARTLQRREENPRLWAGIRARLQDEARAEQERRARWNFDALWQGFAAHWQLVTAALLLLAVTAAGTWMMVQRTGTQPVARDAERRLLTDKALKETQAAEASYVQSIERLAALAEPKISKADTPLAANYREKLLVLDAAITECRKQADANKYNAHLQRELTSLYQEKKQTLEAVLRED
ncbi:MAG TPA: hypothetical protein VGQ11_13480 [Candidatus Acidoferrales bacterium]|nr:hypothetical protein [Candidatus Acidoferrales bacterium]